MRTKGQGHDPKVKAKAVADLALGMSQSAVAKKYKVAPTTVRNWAKDLDPSQIGPNHKPSLKQAAFEESLRGFATAALRMLTAQAEFLSDTHTLNKLNTADVISHTRFVAERLAYFIQLDLQRSDQGGLSAQAGEGGTKSLPSVAQEEVA